MKNCDEAGGLWTSGTIKVRKLFGALSAELKGHLPIIGVGGIDSVIAAREDGCRHSLVQIYFRLYF